MKLQKSDSVTEHHNLRLYLESRMIYPPFLGEKYPKLRRKYEILSSFQLISQVLWTLRYICFLMNSEDDPLNYYLADVNYMLGPARVPVNLLFLLMNIISLITVVFTKFSTYIQPGEHHHWLRDCEVFETGYFRGIGDFHLELKLLYWFKYVLITLDLIIVTAADILYFAVTPPKYFIFGIIFFIYHMFDAGIILFYMINRQAFFIFHMYLYIKYFDHLIKSLVNSPHLITNYLTSHKDLIGLYNYYQKNLFYVFIVLTGGQVFVCYYIFFSNIVVSIKLSLASVTIAAHPNIVGIFVIGTIQRNKVCSRKNEIKT